MVILNQAPLHLNVTWRPREASNRRDQILAYLHDLLTEVESRVDELDAAGGTAEDQRLEEANTLYRFFTAVDPSDKGSDRDGSQSSQGAGSTLFPHV